MRCTKRNWVLMRRDRSVTMKYVCLWLLAILGIQLSACGRASPGNDGLGPWQEEVELSDGRMIVVERFEDIKVSTLLGDPVSAKVKAARIKIIAPAELAGIPELTMRQRPVVFDYDAELGTWFALDVKETCGFTQQDLDEGIFDKSLRIIIRPYREYRLIEGTWREALMDSKRIGRPTNLLIDRRTIQDFEVFPLSVKRRLDSDTAIPREYREIVERISCR